MKYYTPTKISENIHETPEGFLLCIGVAIARTGSQNYGPGETPLDVGPNGLVSIQRDEEEVFRKETIASFEGKPFTIKHPEDFVTPENWTVLAKGIIQNVRRGEGEEKDDLIADLLITDALAISLVKNGLRGLSCGYEAEYIQLSEGKGKQTNIIGNHLALVEEGRAGPAYAINDHKGATVTKLEKLLAKLGLSKESPLAKTIDEAMGEEEKTSDAGAYDELVKICKDLGAKLDAMKPKDEAKKDEPVVEKKEENKDEEAPASGMEERMKALEMAVAKILEKLSVESGDEESDEITDEEESEMTGDTASRVEILAPGLKMTKDVKSAALKKAYESKEGKRVIDSLSGGKPTFDSAELFVAASEVLKLSRVDDLSRTKTGTVIFKDSDEKSFMTAEKMNEINAKIYNLK